MTQRTTGQIIDALMARLGILATDHNNSIKLTLATNRASRHLGNFRPLEGQGLRAAAIHLGRALDEHDPHKKTAR